jgi:hypothetical protein
MLRRIKRYIAYKFVGYVPGISKLASMEAKRLSKHIFDNWDEQSQLIILEDIKINLIEMREYQIKNKELEILKAQQSLNYLQNNFIKLKLR